MAVTLKDVAKQAGVSVATVSRVLSDNPKISESTKAKVRFYVEKLGYRTNIAARSLKTNRSGFVGFIFPMLNNDVITKFYDYIEEGLRSKGHHLLLFNSRESIEGEKEAVEQLMASQVDGVVVSPSTMEGHHLQKLQDNDIPVIVLGHPLNNLTADTVCPDNIKGTYDAMDVLLRNGIHRVGYIGGRKEMYNEEQRHDGYVKALHDYGLPYHVDYVIFSDFTYKAGYEAMKNLMEQEEPPEAVFLSNLLTNRGAMGYVIEKLPEKKARPTIVCFDRILDPLYDKYVDLVVEQSLQTSDTVIRILEQRLKGDILAFPQVKRLKTHLVNANELE